MPEHETSPDLAAQIETAAADLDRSLRRLDITKTDRQVLVDDVRADLERAAEDGVGPAALVGTDVDAFAREAVEASGYRPRPRDYPVVALNGTLAAAAAVAGGFALVVLLLQPLLAQTFTLDRHYPTAGPVLAYTAVAVLGLLGTFGVLHQLLAGRSASRETLLRAVLLVPLAAGAGVAGAVYVWQQPGYVSTERVVYGQLLLVAVPVALALITARLWGLRAAARDEVREQAGSVLA